ncbi:MAG: fumarylacetoacetate hydrolase family protein [Verrucomicrobia bacterium]|nr:fumarylacetoacetate hydrolase family protein [Verrucomicrobiota bacterium]
MKTYGYFHAADGSGFHGEVLGDGRVQPLAGPPWEGAVLDDRREPIALSALRVGVPVQPSKIVAVGLNYHDHARERNKVAPKTPLTWLEAPSSLLADGGTVVLPFPEHRIDYEAELAIVIGREAKNVSREQALEHVFGYSSALDITDRTLQDSEGQFARAKGFDTFTPVGPFVYVGAEVADIPVQLELNGELRQNGRTGEMIFPPAEMIAFISRGTTLKPGDVIITGTPAGVGNIKAGDQIEVRIGHFAPLRVTVAAE